MALEATHIRFALDLKDKYQIKAIEKYLAGTIYPDSRYVSGIDRDITHGKDILKLSFIKNDFNKGWQVHQICDLIQREIMIDLFPEFDFKNGGKDKNIWVKATAIKIIQDMDDMRKFDLQKYLKHLNYTDNPNGEDIKKVKEYNKLIINLYENNKNITIMDSYKMWLGLGIGEKLAEKVKKTAEDFLKNKTLVSQIIELYDKMIKDYKNILNKLEI